MTGLLEGFELGKLDRKNITLKAQGKTFTLKIDKLRLNY